MSKKPVEDQDVDRIAEVFRGRTVFISGATGFIGKVLIEKLLRCTDVKRLYLLIREKKGKTPEQRLQDIFSHVLYEKLRNVRPEALKKAAVIVGDVTEVDLGISTEDRETLRNEVNFIFHSAASTRFDDTVRRAVQINTRGTKYMLDLAQQCKNLKLFIHVSTAYAFPKEKILRAKPYPPPADPHEVLNSINWMKDETMSNATKELLGDIPNTYTFSKALAEALVNEQVGKLPVVICRPGVVIPAYQDPIPGFFNNMQGPMGILTGAGKGVIRTMYMDSRSYANLIPVDSTVHAMMISVWNYLTVGGQHYVFNLCVPTEDIKLNWEEIIEIGKEVLYERVPFNGILWYPGGEMTKSKPWYYFNFFLFQIIPALFIDLLLIILGYKPVLFQINMRLAKGQEMFEFYTTQSWEFDTDYLIEVRKKLTKYERTIYKVDAEGLDLKKYFEDSALYARRHILKETDDMLPAAKRNLKIMFVLDRVVKIAFFAAVIYYTYRFFFGSAVTVQKTSVP